MVLVAGPGLANAQQDFWIQVEGAVRTADDVAKRAQIYAPKVENVRGMAKPPYFSVAIGPFTEAEARNELSRLRRAGTIPSDAFIARGNSYTEQVWPKPGEATAPAPAESPTETAATPAPEPEPAPEPIPAEETRAEARASERALDREAKRDLQRALQYEGFYNSTIDGSFGQGTRRSMAAWQEAKGYEATGILTSKQRQILMETYNSAMASLGLETITDEAAGIEITLPMGMVQLADRQAPFARYDEKGDSGVEVLLISQTGDDATLGGLYDLLEGLEIVPLEGDRTLDTRDFTLTGSNARVQSYAYARLVDGHVKGYLLSWPAGADRRQEVALEAMKNSFKPLPDQVLADEEGAALQQGVNLLVGLAVREPTRARSGVFIDNVGHVLTAFEAVEGCTKITINENTDAVIQTVDQISGLALLAPTEEQAPLAVAALVTEAPVGKAQVAVAGYPYGSKLRAPILTFGTLAELQGLEGEVTLARLELDARPGDTGGAVLDANGGLLGVLLPPHGNGNQQLPEGVSLAVNAGAVAEFLAAQGIATEVAEATEALHPEDLSARAADMATVINCWN
ncbi:MAG: trypsin-like peptidase domain-containing protein [Rhodobacteraceae bacterium]|nr:trypsin-like peptidase domain-containing protein [Paracoccaceae bacterium]